MAFQSFVSGLALFINVYATPVALKNIGWKTYTIFRKSFLQLDEKTNLTSFVPVVFHFLQFIAMYFFIVETKQRSLEELEDIFNDPKPVKKSLEKRQVVITEGVKVELESS